MAEWEIDPTPGAILELAAAIRELAAAMRPPAPEPEPEYHCPKCGSPRWECGGMGRGFKKCLDCGEIGEEIADATSNP